MKIRCKNCFRVLNENEEYCTSCGEHSEEMADFMKNGKKELGESGKLKLALVLFAFIAFLGTGLLSIGFAAIEGTVDHNVMYNLNSRFFTSIILLIALGITFRKDFKNIFFKSNLNQLLGAFGIGFMFIAIVCLLSLLTSFTKILPNYMTEYLSLTNRSFESFREISIFRIIITVIFVNVCEEYIFRHRLIDFFDDATMLGDIAIIIISSIISTILSFAWSMTIETLLMTFIINAFMTCVYIYTNRSLGICLILRVLLSLSIITIYIIL